MAILIKNARLSFPSLFAPSAYKDAKPSYSATLLIPKGSDSAKIIEDEIKRVAKEAFGPKAEQVLSKQNEGQRRLLKDGDGSAGKSNEGEVRDGYAGNWVLKVSNKSKPTLINRAKENIDESSGLLYGGCLVNAQIEIWPQNNDYGKFINAKLLAVQHWADGESFGVSSKANLDAFDAAEDDAGDF
jgi:hypothetical protein